MGETQEPDSAEPSFLPETACHAGERKHRTGTRADCLGEIAECLSITLAATPIVSSAIIEHVFQGLIHQFYEKRICYLPNFGWLFYNDGNVIFEPCQAMKKTLERMKKAIEAETVSLAGIEHWVDEKLG